LFVSKAQRNIYPSIMMAPKNKSDRSLFEVTGLFKYDLENDAFFFGDSLKITNNTNAGNLITYNNKKSEIELEGNFNLGSELSYFNIKTAGKAIASFEKQETSELEIMTGLEFFIPEKLVKMMVNDFKQNSIGARSIDYLTRKDFYNQALANFIPMGKDYANTKAKMLNYGLELPNKYDPFQFLLTELTLTWNEEYGAFYSKLDQFGLASIAGEPINKMLEGYLECRMGGSNDKFFLYIAPNKGQFYFFQYENGILMTVSSNEAYNEAVENLKKNEKLVKKKGGDTYEVELTSGGRARSFVNRVKSGR